MRRVRHARAVAARRVRRERRRARRRRRGGLGGQVMGELERVVERAYDLGALSASADGARLYTSRGWRLWRGGVRRPEPAEGDIRLPDEEDSATYVRPRPSAGALDPAHALLFDWRDGDVL